MTPVRRDVGWAGLGAAATLIFPPLGHAAANTVQTLEITATRIPEEADRVPVFITVLTGEDLRARRVTDLRGALALVAGVEAPAGGDAGPASAVASLWGLHEFDAFLLVVDGVPLGGAFNPAVAALDLTNVERIEVLKGAAPVVFGATAFVGVIQVIHYPAGQAARQVEAGYAGHGGWRASVSVALPALGQVKQSLSLSARRDGFADPRSHVRDFRGLYRAATPLAGGDLRLDADIEALRSVPFSPVVREGDHLTNLTPRDSNFNPTDGRIDETRYHGVLAYAHPTPLGPWETTLSLATSHITDVRGFLRSDLSAPTADTQIQSRHLIDDYADSHINSRLADGLTVTWGADLLYGRGAQSSANGGYDPDLSGAAPPPRAADLHVDEINALIDRRLFWGQYIQADWKIGERLDVNGGLRLNETRERKRSSHIDGFDPTANQFDDQTARHTRLSGMIGASYRAWSRGPDALTFYANYRDTFKPAAVDFGPDNTPDILLPESGRSYEVGVKGAALAGRLDYQLGLFRMDLRNLVVAVTNPAGDHILQNAGAERLQGAEAEVQFHMAADLSLTGAVSYHDARFTNYVAAEDGANLDVSGNRLTLSPKLLASAGLIWSPPQGLFASFTVSYVASRFLNLANTARAGAYGNLDAGVGYRWGRYSLSLDGANLTDQREPVTASEFGSGSFYLSPGRTLSLALRANY